MDAAVHQTVAQARQKGGEPGLGRAVDIVRRPPAKPRDRGDAHKRAVTARLEPLGKGAKGQSWTLEIGAHHGCGGGRVLLAFDLIAHRPDRAQRHVRKAGQTGDECLGVAEGVIGKDLHLALVPQAQILCIGLQGVGVARGQPQVIARGGKGIGAGARHVRARAQDQEGFCHSESLLLRVEAKDRSSPWRARHDWNSDQRGSDRWKMSDVK